MLRFVLCLAGLVAGSTAAPGALTWPTPNPAFQQGLPIETFVQPTVSGRTESGLFGCVRNGGARFHEGLDLLALEHDARGEATDAVYAILPGRVVHASSVAGHSSYGRYVVVVHEAEPAGFHSLYAHLASVHPGIRPGVRVEAGQALGVMGRSAAGYSIPKSRAHLHLEIGFRLTDAFQAWYDRQGFGSKNRHGVWNGINLVSVDPLDFYRRVRAGELGTLAEYLRRLPAAARIRVFSARIPDFMRNYPALATRPVDPARELVAWDIAFTEFGVPKEWTPRFADEALDGRPGDVRLLAYHRKLIEAQSCRRVVELRADGAAIGSGTLEILRKLFDFR